MSVSDPLVQTVRAVLHNTSSGLARAKEKGHLQGREVSVQKECVAVAFKHVQAAARQISPQDLSACIESLESLAHVLHTLSEKDTRTHDAFLGAIRDLRGVLHNRQNEALQAYTRAIEIPVDRLDVGDWFVRGMGDTELCRVVADNGAKRLETTSFGVNEQGLLVRDDTGKVAPDLHSLFGLSDDHAAVHKYEVRNNGQTFKAFAATGFGPKRGVLFVQGNQAGLWDCLTFGPTGKASVRSFNPLQDRIETVLGNNPVLKVSDIERLMLWDERIAALKNVAARGETVSRSLAQMHAVAPRDVEGLHWFAQTGSAGNEQITCNMYDAKGILHTFEVNLDEIEHRLIVRQGAKTIGFADNPAMAVELIRQRLFTSR